MPPANLQEITERLRSFWSGEGCAELPAADQPIAHSILAPQCFLQLLASEGRKTWRVQCLRRPSDGRYGRNNLHQAQRLEFQVLIKPGDPEVAERVARSLLALGFELGNRDWVLRDVYWSVPAVGLKGAGWGGLLDGVPVARILYFTQLGETELSGTPVEVIYSLELLALLQQRVSDVDSVEWSTSGASSAAMRWRSEDQHSPYYLETADSQALHQQLAAHEREAARALAAKLPVPAYEAVLSALHAAEGLEARGALRPWEREVIDSRLSDLAHECAMRYLERSGASVAASRAGDGPAK